jgi:hypothetical protein
MGTKEQMTDFKWGIHIDQKTSVVTTLVDGKIVAQNKFEHAEPLESFTTTKKAGQNEHDI